MGLILDTWCVTAVAFLGTHYLIFLPFLLRACGQGTPCEGGHGRMTYCSQRHISRKRVTYDQILAFRANGSLATLLPVPASPHPGEPRMLTVAPVPPT